MQCNLYVNLVHINTLKQALNQGLILKKVHRVITFNHKAWLKRYIDVNTKFRKEAENHFEKDFFKLMSYSGFGETMENVRKHRDIKLVTTDKRRNLNFQNLIIIQQNGFPEGLLAIKMNKIKIKANK